MQFRQWSKVAASAAAILLFQQACGGDTTSPVVATKLSLATAPSATAASRSTFATQPVIQLQDARGNAAAQAGIVVTTSITAGGGALAGTATAMTGSNGAATFSNLSISGIVGPQTLSFSAPGLTSLSATVTLTPGTATTIVVNAGNNQSATAGSAVATPPSVKVTDADGNAVSGQAVAFAIASGSGSITGANANTGSDGVAAIGSWTLGNTAGANTLNATATGLTGSPVAFTATATLVRVATVVVTLGSGTLTVSQTTQATAVPRDGNGSALTGRLIAWSTSDAGVATVASSGLVTAVAPGSATITATSEGKSGGATVTVTAPVPVVTVGNWTSIGPHHINGPGGTMASGKLQALAVFAGDPRIMYAGGGMGSGREGPVTEAGAWKTTDGGGNWTAINAGLADPMVNALWVDQVNSNVVLAGTEFGGIFKSVNGGMSWAPAANLGATSEFVSVSGKLFAATAAGVAQSEDLGTTWAVVQPTTSPVRALAAGGGAVVAGLQNGTLMMQSTPTGVWQTATPGGEVASVAVDASNPTTAYAVVGCCPGTLVGTSNGGLTWSSITIPFGPQAVLMTSDTHILYAAGGQGLLSTTNGGQSWTEIPIIYGWDIRKIFVVPGQSTIILGTDQGLHQTSNAGVTWADLSGGVSVSILLAVAVRGQTIITTVQDFSPILSFDGGLSWQQPVWTSANPPVGESGTAVINPANSSYCYVYTGISGYQYSTDGCRTFHFTSAPGLTGVFTYTQPGLPDIVAVDPSTPSTVYAASKSGVFKSTDWGVTMTPTSWPMTETTAIAVDASDGRIIYVGTSSTLYRTQDGGVSWTSTLLPGGFPATIAVDPRNTQNVLVGVSRGPGQGGGVLRSKDRGNTFAFVNAGISIVSKDRVCCGVDMTSLRFDPNSVVALATSNGIYVSADLGDHWQNVSANAVPTYFTDVTWDGGYLYGATFGAGVLRAPVRMTPSAVMHRGRP